MEKIQLTEKSRDIINEMIQKESLEYTIEKLTVGSKQLMAAGYWNKDVDESHAQFMAAYHLDELISRLEVIKEEQYGEKDE